MNNNEKLLKVHELGPELLAICKRFLSAKGSLTFGYYSDEQMKALQEMRNLVNLFEEPNILLPVTEQEQQADELIQLREAVSKATNNGITLSLSGNKKDHDLIKKNYLGKYEVSSNKKDTVDHYLDYLKESFILGAEDRLEILVTLLNNK